MRMSRGMMRSRSPKGQQSALPREDDEDGAASVANRPFVHLDELEAGGDGTPDSPGSRLSLEVEPLRQPTPRGRRYLPRLPPCRDSPTLAFLSHGCFIGGSLAYVLLALGDLSWYRTTAGVPREVYNADDDAAWERLGNDELWDAKDDYDWTYHVYYLTGAVSFVVVGALDWMRYGECMDAFMILAGLAGVASVMAPTARQEVIWDAVSIHLYLFEACNLFRREHNKHLTGRDRLFRVGDVCFLAGNIIDVTVVYLGLAGRSGLGIIRADLAAQILWLICALIDTAREVYFLR